MSHSVAPYVLYWLRSAPRLAFNASLQAAIVRANQSELPLIIYFELNPHFPSANDRNFTFLLQGIQEFATATEKLGATFVLHQTGTTQTPSLEQLLPKAAHIVTDHTYLRFQRQWLNQVQAHSPNPIEIQETNTVVPISIASAKAEYSAATLRRKLRPLISKYLQPDLPLPKLHNRTRLPFHSLHQQSLDQLIKQLPIDHSAPPAPQIGGETAARTQLAQFLKISLPQYHTHRNDPTHPAVQSQLSAYLHFGHISPKEIALAVDGAKAPQAAQDAYLEELLVRRELAHNFVWHTPQYDSIDCLPEWAQKTLARHHKDQRTYLYSRKQLETAQTHDPYWNAAQLEMVKTGKMHGYMRMYWGKKVLEWNKTPADAYQTLVYLNDKYELDGRDPNGYAGIAWCFGKHDRPWFERPIFGTVRYMAASGLERKFAIAQYVENIAALMQQP